MKTSITLAALLAVFCSPKERCKQQEQTNV